MWKIIHLCIVTASVNLYRKMLSKLLQEQIRRKVIGSDNEHCCAKTSFRHCKMYRLIPDTMSLPQCLARVYTISLLFKSFIIYPVPLQNYK